MSDQELKPCPNKLCKHNVDCSSECYSCGYSDCVTELSRTPDQMLEELAGALEKALDHGLFKRQHINEISHVWEKYQQSKVQP